MQQERTANKAECEFHLVWWCLSTQREDTPNKSHILSIWQTKADTDSRGDMLHWPLQSPDILTFTPCTPLSSNLAPSLPFSYSYFPLKHPTELLMGICWLLHLFLQQPDIPDGNRLCADNRRHTERRRHLRFRRPPLLCDDRESTMGMLASWAPTQIYFTLEYDATPIHRWYTCSWWGGTHATGAETPLSRLLSTDCQKIPQFWPPWQQGCDN